MGLGRFLDKRVLFGEGLAKGGDSESPGVFLEDGKVVMTAATNVEGLITATMGIVGSFTSGTAKTGALSVGGLVTATMGIVGSMTIGKLKTTDITASSLGIDVVTCGSATITDLLFANVTGSSAGLDVLTCGSANITDLLVANITGSAANVNTLAFKGSTALTNMWGIVASLDFGAIGVHGSVNATAVLDTAMSGVSVGDLVVGNPIGSIDIGLLWGLACHSAGNVQVRMAFMGSGPYADPGVTPFKIYCIK